MRATRDGGSFSSSARAPGATKLRRPVKHSSRPSQLLAVNVVVFMTNPLFSDRAAGLGDMASVSAPIDGSVTSYGSHRVEPHNGKEVAHVGSAVPDARISSHLTLMC